MQRADSGLSAVHINAPALVDLSCNSGGRWEGRAGGPASTRCSVAWSGCPSGCWACNDSSIPLPAVGQQQGAGTSSGLPLGCHSYYAALGTGRAPERAQRYPRCHMLSASPLQWRPPMLTTRSCSSAATRGRTTWRWAQARCARCGRRARKAPRCPSPGAWLLPAGDWRWQPGLPRLHGKPARLAEGRGLQVHPAWLTRGQMALGSRALHATASPLYTHVPLSGWRRRQLAQHRPRRFQQPH